MLIAVRLRDKFQRGELSSDLFKEWLRNIPAAVEEVKVEAGFDSFSSLILFSIPISMSCYLPRDLAIIKLGPVTSSNFRQSTRNHTTQRKFNSPLFKGKFNFGFLDTPVDMEDWN